MAMNDFVSRGNPTGITTQKQAMGQEEDNV
jgi:hypothetical protein